MSLSIERQASLRLWEQPKILQLTFFALGALCLSPWVSSPLALTLGILFSLTVGQPCSSITRTWTPRLLQASIVGLGAGTELMVIGRVGLQGLGYTAGGILLTLILGEWLGRFFENESRTSLLISAGTAICGGSAIAAVSPVIRAKSEEVSVALAVVFLLNSVALVVFPPIGHGVGLTQAQFGLWSALAIHDTSSVMGASLQYGAEASQIAVTLKLVRSLWIIPVALGLSLWIEAQRRARESQRQDYPASENPPSGWRQAKKPWFIFGFLATACAVSFFPVLRPWGLQVAEVARQGLRLSLFFIGAGISRQTIRYVGLRPLLQGLTLWVVVSGVSLILVLKQVITYP